MIFLCQKLHVLIRNRLKITFLTQKWPQKTVFTSEYDIFKKTTLYIGERFIETPREQDFTDTTKGTSDERKETFVTNCETLLPSGTDFDLVLCVTRIGDVQATLDITVMNSNVVTKASTYHVPTESKPNACRHGFRKAFKTSGGVKFAPRQFEISKKYVNFAESDQEIVQMEDFVNDKVETNANMKTVVIAKSVATKQNDERIWRFLLTCCGHTCGWAKMRCLVWNSDFMEQRRIWFWGLKMSLLS